MCLVPGACEISACEAAQLHLAQPSITRHPWFHCRCRHARRHGCPSTSLFVGPGPGMPDRGPGSTRAGLQEVPAPGEAPAPGPSCFSACTCSFPDGDSRHPATEGTRRRPVHMQAASPPPPPMVCRKSTHFEVTSASDCTTTCDAKVAGTSNTVSPETYTCACPLIVGAALRGRVGRAAATNATSRISPWKAGTIPA